jgi:hypothetical protein
MTIKEVPAIKAVNVASQIPVTSTQVSFPATSQCAIAVQYKEEGKKQTTRSAHICSTVHQNERLNVKVLTYSTRSRGSYINRQQLNGTIRARSPICVAVLLKQ